MTARRLLVVTDAWAPQTNGVVTTWQQVIRHLPECGYTATIAHPGSHRTFAMPGYAEIRLAVDPWKLSSRIEQADPDAIHVVTEGPLGIAARRWCVRHHVPFTTSVHTKFPEYVAERSPLSPAAGYAYLRWFHRHSSRVLAMSASHAEELAANGLTNLNVWLGGVDTARFRPMARTRRTRPRLLYAGRVAVEKNLEAFLELDLDADKVVVGDGPHRSALETRFPDVQWLGYKRGDALTREFSDADVFVFPSRTDTFGLVMLEANACGTPVAAYPVTGPMDLIRTGENGVLHDDLTTAVQRALAVDRHTCRLTALERTWAATTNSLVKLLAPAKHATERRTANG